MVHKSTKLQHKLFAYSAAASAVLVGTVGPEARMAEDNVVFDVVPDFAIDAASETFDIDFDQDGNHEIRLGLQANGTTRELTLLSNGGDIGQAWRGFSGAGCSVVAIVAQSAYIFINSSVYSCSTSPHTIGSSTSSGNRYIVVKFTRNETGMVHHGWIELNVSVGPNMVVQRYGYNTLSNMGITTGTGNPLPVELTSFDARVQDNNVLLQWRTATETNNAGFELQQRVGEDYRAIDFIEGHGTTTEAQHYSYRMEDLLPGRHTFRLKQIDFDGSFAFSRDVEVEVELPGTHLLTDAYPNPFNPSTQFALFLAQEQNVKLEVFDVTGRHIQTLHQGTLSENTQHLFRFEADALPGGQYMIRATGENFTETKQVTLVK